MPFRIASGILQENPGAGATIIMGRSCGGVPISKLKDGCAPAVRLMLLAPQQDADESSARE
jgi:hypothetical protein